MPTENRAVLCFAPLQKINAGAPRNAIVGKRATPPRREPTSKTVARTAANAGRIIVRGLATASRNCVFGTQTSTANAIASGYSATEVNTCGATSVLNTPPSTPPAASQR